MDVTLFHRDFSPVTAYDHPTRDDLVVVQLGPGQRITLQGTLADVHRLFATGLALLDSIADARDTTSSDNTNPESGDDPSPAVSQEALL